MSRKFRNSISYNQHFNDFFGKIIIQATIAAFLDLDLLQQFTYKNSKFSSLNQ